MCGENHMTGKCTRTTRLLKHASYDHIDYNQSATLLFAHILYSLESTITHRTVQAAFFRT
jgi:hypothetical protein